MGDDVFTILGMLIVFAAVLFLAWLTTKLLGKRMAGGAKNKNMKIVETLPLGMDRCLHLIRVGKRFFLFHASRKSFELVSEIEMDEEAIESQENENDATKVFDFKRIFESYSGLVTNRQAKKAETESTLESQGIEGIQGNIKKLQRLTQGKEYKS